MSNRKYHRPEVRQVTKQWVKENCKNITDRDIGLLRAIHDNKRRLLRRDQLERLYPEFASTDRLNKRLKMLYQKHIIDRIYPPVGLGEGSSKQYICLDRAGIILLELEKYNKPIATDSFGNKSLPLGWEHKVMLNEYECIIRETVAKLGGIVRLYWVEEPHPFHDTKVIPDITCLIVHNKKGYLFFIEVDLGTEDIPYIKTKIDNYKDYYLSKQWVATQWAKVFKSPVFPRILFLTQEGRKKRQITLQDYTKESGLRFQFGFHSELESTLTEIMKS